VSVPRLLLVEDQVDLARVLQRILRSRSLDVHTTSSCREALDLDEQWDCAILDVDLPDGNGVDLAYELLASAKTAAVVFFSAESSVSVRTRAEQYGPFVSKCADIDDLVDTVHAEVDRARKAGAIASGTYVRFGRQSSDAAKRRAKA
jgi:DNA-binding response OmpR family regulator